MEINRENECKITVESLCSNGTMNASKTDTAPATRFDCVVVEPRSRLLRRKSLSLPATRTRRVVLQQRSSAPITSRHGVDCHTEEHQTQVTINTYVDY